ncbi:zinc finger HIT domain-containing protein 2 isoform X1 [Vigna unguiculata]|uniref:Protein SHQ1 n=2 Tax=Vigna unguiculata TaxID=3917 RepID=A0A4D6NR69_VIGUN|nr:zinc finger HIT domain-containing protein 2 isoform X1 [Vigna unguiculata]XP_027904724.1 zinc finger HIT domain-containing protein 2 isoform X1 [Vigna unguiculata]XP_027904725.1 zinc finger HIT domain-containing protein 2 isoform X1 [Vigna unguiculata]XP_027904726.1 zinc finger HIT domain-containing protein 2 isoform X1 [Vigna unguiculata]XP_027904727.1 zinc finger HIT domain-containing protein 2 isoform X1 [Vigna unguiculata]QCE15421.1 protein SHQ1 [Vigna unguiculata]
MADNIVTSAKSSTPSPNPIRIICHVCQKQFSQYTCPRCNSRYCSLQCYKSHSLRCTESFMKENVVQELQQMQPDEQTKNKMLDILKRFHSEEEMDEDSFADSTLSEETMEKLLSGQEISFDDLSLEEKKQFHRAIAYGELSKMIKPWDPWWSKPSARKIRLSSEGTQLVQLLPEKELPDDIVGEEFSEVPAGPETPLPPLSSLSSREPSPLLTVHLVDILYSYCFTLRLYNGDWRSDALGSVTVVLSLSSVLGQGAQPETVLEALSHFLEQVCCPAYRHVGGLQFGLSVIDDVISLLSLGTSALVCALCDMHRLIQEGEKEARSERPRKSRRDGIRRTIKLAERKIYFIMCWVHEQPEEAWSSLAAIVRAEKTSAMQFQWSNKAEKLNNKAEAKGKRLIEEI